MKLGTLTTAIVLTLSWHGAVLAGLSVEERRQHAEQSMALLQQKPAAREGTIEEQQATMEEQIAFKEGGPKRMQRLADTMEKKRAAAVEEDAWYRKIEIGGLIEVEAGYHDPYGGDSESDIVLATLELGISSQLGDWVELGGSLLYEQHQTPLEIDVAYATVANPQASPFFLTAGRIYLPFGAYETHMVSDPLTLEIGETRENALQAGFVKEGFNGSLYVFDGSNGKEDGSRIDNWGANLGYTRESGELTWAAGIGYISDLGDSSTLQDVIGDNAVSGRVSGWTLNAGAGFGPFTLIGEYLAATHSFEAAAVPWNLRGARPKAWNIEAGYRFDLLGKDATVAVGYQGSREALALELPKERWVAAFSVDVIDHATLSLEWAHDRDYGRAGGGSGNSANTLTAQLAVEF